MKAFYALSLAFFLTISAFAQQAARTSFIRDSLDAYVEQGLKNWKIPGVSVGIVQDGKVVLAKGYGVREMNGSEKVDENTLFMIGSNTKAMTATLLAMLDTEKKLSLNDKVTKWLPEFRLFDSCRTQEAILADLLCHRLGFATFQGDFMYFDSDLTSAEVLKKLAKVKPAFGLRMHWGYTNAAFLAAGEVVHEVTGETWAATLTSKIFKPLGMNRSLALSKDIEQAANRATAHTVVRDTLSKVPYGDIDNIAPAGSVSSSASDMTHWLMAQLNKGEFEGKQAIAADAIGKTWAPYSIIGNSNPEFNSGNFALYGLGWMLRDYAGHKIVSHTGGVNGFVSSVSMVPDKNLGVVVLTNTDANGFYSALGQEIQDALLGLPFRNYSQKAWENFKREKEKELQSWNEKLALIKNRPKPPVPLAEFVGTYRHNVYGAMQINPEKDGLVATFQHHKNLTARLDVVGDDQFLARFSNAIWGNEIWTFKLEKDKVHSLTVKVSDFVEYGTYEFLKETR